MTIAPEAIEPSDRWDARGASLAAAVVAAGAAIEWLARGRTYGEPIVTCLHLLETAIWFCTLASAVVGAFQILGSVAGRGRAMPGARWAPLARAAVAAILVVVFRDAYGRTGLAVEAALGAALCGSALLEVISRLRGPGILWPLIAARALGFACGAWLDDPVVILAMLLVAGTIRLLDLRPSRLAALGVTPWAPSDLIALPPMIAASLRIWMEASLRSHVYPGGWQIRSFELLVATLEVLALVYLDRSLRVAEARAAGVDLAWRPIEVEDPPSLDRTSGAGALVSIAVYAGIVWIVRALSWDYVTWSYPVLPESALSVGGAAACAGGIAVAALQLLAALVPHPRARARGGPAKLLAVRTCAALLALVVMRHAIFVTDIGWPDAIAAIAWLAVLEAISRLRGPGVAALGAIIVLYALRLYSLPRPGILAMAMGALLIVLRWRGMSASRLAAVGLTPWAPSDLVAIPFVAAVAVVGGDDFDLDIGEFWSTSIVVVVTLFEAVALLWLDQRLRRAERDPR